MWLTRTAILRPVTMTMAVIAIIVLGYTALTKMGVDLYPDIDVPFVTIVTTYPGAGPEEVETQITKQLEDAISLIAGVKTVTSTSQESVSLVFLEFELGTDLDTATADVRSKVDSVRALLPREIDAPVITKADIQAIAVLNFGIASPRPPKEIRDIADDIISQRLARVPGVAAVSVSGGEVREILVSVDKGRLEAYGLTLSQVSSALSMENLNLPSGNITEGPNEYAVRAIGEFQSIDDLRQVRLQTDSDTVVSLNDIAAVSDTVAERRALTRLNGRDSVTISVLKQAGANTVAVADGVKEELQRLTGQPLTRAAKKSGEEAVRTGGILPSDISIELGYDQSVEILNTIAEVRLSLVLGALLATLIVFLFLHNVRGTFIVALAIPTSVLATFAPIYFAGFTLNMMVLLGLSLSVGILVDDSIVVLENIWRHLRKGEPPREAALNGRTEIGLAAITITLVDVVVFVPIAFMGGIVGQFFRQFGITVATATLFSLFVSFTLTPMLASRWFKREDADEESLQRSRLWGFFSLFDKFYNMLDIQYRRLLQWTLNHRAATVFIGIISLLACVGIAFTGGQPLEEKIVLPVIMLFLGIVGILFSRGSGRAVLAGVTVVSILLTFLSARALGFEMFPQADSGQFQVSLEMPPGTPLEATSRVAQQVEHYLLSEERFPEIENVFANIGSGSGNEFGGGMPDTTLATIQVVLVEQGERDRSDLELMQEIRQWALNLPGPKVKAKRVEHLSGGEFPIEIVLSSEDEARLLQTARLVADLVAQIDGTKDVDISWKEGRPELQARVDRIALADRGLSAFAVAAALRTGLEGTTDTKFRDRGKEYDIRVQLQESDRSSLEQIRQLPVSFNGGVVRLEDIANLRLATSPNKIDRRNRVRTISIYSDVMPGYFEGNLVDQEIRPALEEMDWGAVSYEFAGETQSREESMGNIVQALGLSIILVYILMAALFEGYLSPFIIMFSLPMALVGALLALVLTGSSVSIVAMIGVIMLMGLVTKNAILLVDYTNTLRARGKPRAEAILEAGPTRLRPILMTTLAMIFGMLPTAAPSLFRLVEGAEWRAPMAIAVIGGLIVSTLLTLLVIPVLYTIFDDAGTAFMRVFKAVLGRLFP